MDISIIIVNYNTKLLLADCLATVFKKTKNVTFEVIVVDNASTDGSEGYIKERFPNVKWISSGENLGFGKANNLGAKYAVGKYLFLLNSDTLLVNNALLLFFEYAENHQQENIGALGSHLLNIDLKSNNSGGCFPTPKSEISYCLKKLFHCSTTIPNQTTSIDFIVGADLFIKRSIFNDLGGFDNNIFMYYEETDLQFRMNKMGLSRILIKGPQIIHLEGGSFNVNKLSFKRLYMSLQSFNYYIKKHYNLYNRILFRISLILTKTPYILCSSLNYREKVNCIKLIIYGE